MTFLTMRIYSFMDFMRQKGNLGLKMISFSTDLSMMTSKKKKNQKLKMMVLKLILKQEVKILKFRPKSKRS